MRETEDVLREAVRIVTPSAEEKQMMELLASTLIRRTKAAAAKHPGTKRVLLCGSLAKETWLPGHVDVDIFVGLDPAMPEGRFEELGLAIGSEATRGFPRGKKFAQHPYTEALIEGVKVNVVPCFSVRKGEWKSAADRSPFHVQVVRRLSREKKLQVRLLKGFMTGVGVYGAEIETRGFSGYAAEVLIMNHSNFLGVLKYFAAFKPQGQGHLLHLQDPVDSKRDLGVAVSGEKLARMILASRGFLSNPQLGYFRRMRRRERPGLRDSVIAVIFSHRALSEDTLWGELRRTTKHLVRHLEINGFKIARSLAASDNKKSSAILLIPEFDALPALEQHMGPTVDRSVDLDAFVASSGKESRLTWIDDDARVRTLRPRRYTRLRGLLADTIHGRAGNYGASEELERGLKKSGSILAGKELLRLASESGWLRDGIREIVSDALGIGHA